MTAGCVCDLSMCACSDGVSGNSGKIQMEWFTSGLMGDGDEEGICVLGRHQTQCVGVQPQHSELSERPFDQQ